MKKKSIAIAILTALFPLSAINAHSMTIAKDFRISSNENPETVQEPNWMISKTGVVNSVNDNRITINGMRLVLSSSYSHHDGTPQKGDFVKYNMNSQQEITDLWIMHKAVKLNSVKDSHEK